MSSDDIHGDFHALHARAQVALADARPPMPRVKRPIVSLGAGGIVRAAHLPAYDKAAFPVVAVSDPAPGRAAALAHDFSIPRSFDSIADAIAYAPADAVFDIAVPASQLPSILQQLPSGATVLMQKPMGNSLGEARIIRDLCREREFMAAINFQLRYAPNHLGAKALAKAGVIGDLHDIEVQVRTYTPWDLWSFLATAPRLEILYHSIHYLDLVRDWLGTPQGIRATTTINPQTPSLAATRSIMALDYGAAKRVLIATTHGHNFPDSQCSFVQWEGANGAIRMDMGVNLDYPNGKPDTLSYALRGDAAGWQSIAIDGNWFPDAFIGSMGALQAYAEGSASDLPNSFDSAYETMALVEAAYASSAAPSQPIVL